MSTSTSTSTKDLVKAFNDLPRSQKAPSGKVPNEWHFDIRYIHLEPTPSHVLVIFQPQSQFLRLERLPVGVSTREPGLSFFPETAGEAAPEIVRGLLYMFVNNSHMGSPVPRHEGPPLAPWKLMTEDKSLAHAVSMELKRQGVTPAPLCAVDISRPAIIRSAEDRWKLFFNILLRTTGYEPDVRPYIVRPTSIIFNNKLIKDPPLVSEVMSGPDADEELKYHNLIAEYFNTLKAAEPGDGGRVNAPGYAQQLHDRVEEMKKTLQEKPERYVNSAADRGDSEAALDYGLRLLLGLDCKRNRKRAREYLVKAAFSRTASDKVKATAHGVLIYWYVDGAIEDFRLRYLYAACHHANAAAVLAKRVSPPGECAPPNVLRFMKTLLDENLDVPLDVHFFYKDLVRAKQARDAQMQKTTKEMYEKRISNPNRYRCAAVDCLIETDTGTKLLRCNGKCDKDKKPFYCSKECQESDWETHKPFCHPNMPCSVKKYQTPSDIERRTPSEKSPDGSFIIPITDRDGKTTLFSSSTMTPTMLKALKAATESGGTLHEHLASMRLEVGSIPTMQSDGSQSTLTY